MRQAPLQTVHSRQVASQQHFAVGRQPHFSIPFKMLSGVCSVN
jgi:hypothetical protein